jgi:hypothetical protein
MLLTSNKRFFAFLLAIPTLLLIPAVAMLFTSEVYWTAGDFGMIGILLLLLSFAVEGALRIRLMRNERILLVTGVLLAFVLVWLELAVGILGSSVAGT